MRSAIPEDDYDALEKRLLALEAQEEEAERSGSAGGAELLVDDEAYAEAEPGDLAFSDGDDLGPQPPTRLQAPASVRFRGAPLGPTPAAAPSAASAPLKPALKPPVRVASRRGGRAEAGSRPAAAASPAPPSSPSSAPAPLRDPVFRPTPPAAFTGTVVERSAASSPAAAAPVATAPQPVRKSRYGQASQKRG